jgi:hypothetical protein
MVFCRDTTFVAEQRESPGLGKPGLNGQKAGHGVLGGYLRSELRRWWLRCRCCLIQSPRVATLLQLRDRVISDRVSLIFVQPFLQATYDLPEHLSAKAIAYLRTSPFIIPHQNI